MDFGWKKKADRLRMVILSAGHQMAKELPPGLSKMLAIYKRVAQDGGTAGGGPALQQEMEEALAGHRDDPKMLWEPIEVHGWKIQASTYLDNGQLWWILHAARRTSSSPSASDVKILDKILAHLGADPDRDVTIGPRSSPPGEGLLPFGWWTWFNRMPLYEIQLKGMGKQSQMRVVPLGTRPSAGFEGVDLTKKDPDE